jgi:hypothetical protein
LLQQDGFLLLLAASPAAASPATTTSNVTSDAGKHVWPHCHIRVQGWPGRPPGDCTHSTPGFSSTKPGFSPARRCLGPKP